MSQVTRLGKLSIDQLRVLVQGLRHFGAFESEWGPLISKKLAHREARRAMSFAWLYERPFAEHVTFFVGAAGLGPWLGSLVERSQTTPEVAIDALADEIADRDPNELRPSKQYTPDEFLALFMTLMRSIQCVSIYQRYLNELVMDGANGHVPSLLKAVRVDAAVLCCPSIARRLELLGISTDSGLRRKVANALTRPVVRQNDELKLVKLLFQAMQELAADRLSADALAQVVVNDLQLVGEALAGDAGKSLSKLRHKARRKSTT